MKKLIFLLGLLLLLSACGTAGDGKQEINNHLVKVKNTEIQGVDRKTGERTARHLEQLASSVPDVHGAKAIVLGKFAIVGIDIDADIERSEAGVIKYSVAEALKDDPYGARAIVVADPDMNARLSEISADIRNGKPLQGILYELADITGRIIPETPGKLIQPNPRNSTEDPKKQLPANDRQKLEQKQEKESSDKK
ncbi:YhcN/YlaJ family sporulation lipoprotein [Bacillus sp. B-jedd]|uniref:YhcN/YlaJ family sporulation lipoprotein n=1 Tax=Bacillus sp. B-jedd TaxID=1476857 RepID=UPI0005155758|nr:YhcN/YlaJ family sporulation lipoprotein [Bacillus sp. B-jedd]CEG26682.1 putative lipoprotein [Bacillus sp. B-jedd]